MRTIGFLFAVLAVSAGDGHPAEVAAPHASRWMLGSETRVGWSSGKDKDLSEWKTVDCAEVGPRFLLTGLTGFREPWANLDNFIAKLKATCTEFDRRSTHTATVFTSANHRDTAYELDALDWQARPEFICPGFYDGGPLGARGVIGTVTIGTNPGNDYVKNFRFRLRCARIFSEDFVAWSTIGDANQMIGEGGYGMSDRVELSCPADNHAATGIQLRFEIGTAKIRDLRLLCRRMIFHAPVRGRARMGSGRGS
jgi:hypothetical protein